MPTHNLPHFDPFLRVEHFSIGVGGFPNQSHNGFEGIFYLFGGILHHDDSLGNHEDISSGGVEVFNTGHGLLHAEMVKEKAHGIRIWVSLPEDMKHSKPSYQHVESKDIPVDSHTNVVVRTVVGEGSPVKTQVKMQLLDVTLRAKSVYMWDIPQGYQGFVYVVMGVIRIHGKTIKASQAALFKDTDSLPILSHDGARLVICFAKPHGETIEVPSCYVE